MQLTINTKKTKSMLFTTSHQTNRWFPPGTPVSSTRKLISSSFHRLDMTLAVAEALNPNKPNQTNRAFLPNLKLKDSKMEHVGNFSYLAVKLDSHLNFNLHLQESIRLVAHKIHLLAMIRSYTHHGAV